MNQAKNLIGGSGEGLMNKAKGLIAIGASGALAKAADYAVDGAIDKAKEITINKAEGYLREFAKEFIKKQLGLVCTQNFRFFFHRNILKNFSNLLMINFLINFLFSCSKKMLDP